MPSKLTTNFEIFLTFWIYVRPIAGRFISVGSSGKRREEISLMIQASSLPVAHPKGKRASLIALHERTERKTTSAAGFYLGRQRRRRDGGEGKPEKCQKEGGWECCGALSGQRVTANK